MCSIANASRKTLLAAKHRCFFAELVSVVEQFEQAIHGMGHARGVQTAAKVGIAGQLEAGLSAVRRLDVLVRIAFADDPQTLAVWARDRKVEKPVWRRAVCERRENGEPFESDEPVGPTESH